MSIDKSADLLKRGISEVIGKDELEKKLNSGKIIRVKFGIDPTSPDLHLGHTVCINKLYEFQGRGHKIILIIGDFTGRIGDPSGRSKTRPVLTKKEILKNMKDYLKQVGKILDVEKCEIVYNSKWYDKMKLQKFMELAEMQTVARVLERDDFQKRIKNNDEISMQEIFYPLLQGYDSVMVKSDLELGGTDQKFNILMGREIQKKLNMPPQAVMTMPLLVGLDGEKKMSKSYDNYIKICETPQTMYGKVMSIPDKLIPSYFELVTKISGEDLVKITNDCQDSNKLRNLKAKLAREIVTLYSGTEDAALAEEEFNRVFRDKEYPIDMPEVKIKNPRCEDLPQMLMDLKLTSSKSEAKRLIEQGGVKVDKAVITDWKAGICFHDKMVIQVGKFKFAKIRL